MTIHRHEVYYADLSSTVGSEQFGIRPVVVIQNNIMYSQLNKTGACIQAERKV